MQVLLLGGQSPRHYDWVRSLRAALKDVGMAVTLHDYAHWLRDEPTIDFETELHEVARLAAELGEYMIVAKSIGTILAIKGTAQGLLTPQACLLLGLPLTPYVDDAEVAAGLATLPRTIVVQNAQDPLGGSEAMRAYIASHAPGRIALVELAGQTHDYADLPLIAQLAIKLQQSVQIDKT